MVKVSLRDLRRKSEMIQLRAGEVVVSGWSDGGHNYAITNYGSFWWFGHEDNVLGWHRVNSEK